MTWLTAFIWTCALETPVYVLVLRRSFRAWWAPVAASLALQVATHPLFWFTYPSRGSWAIFVALEFVVALVEGVLVALVLRKVGDPRPLTRGLLASLLANSLSAAAGLLFEVS